MAFYGLDGNPRLAIPKSAVFVVVEGPDKTWKTTLCTMLDQALRMAGVSPHLTHEPFYPSLRMWLGEPHSAFATGLAMCADRVDHLLGEVTKALSYGGVVVSSRYVPSTWVYQLYLSDMEGFQARVISDICGAFVEPDLYIHLTAPPEVLYARAQEDQSRTTLRDDSDLSLETFAAIVEGFNQFFAHTTTPVLTINTHCDFTEQPNLVRTMLSRILEVRSLRVGAEGG